MFLETDQAGGQAGKAARGEAVKEWVWMIRIKLVFLPYNIDSFICRLKHRKVYRAVGRFVELSLNKVEWSDELEDAYVGLMKLVLRRWLNIRGDLAYIIYDACWGNWERLRETQDEKRMTMAMLIETLANDIEYCSDRWSWDRFLRNNYLYHRIKHRMLEWEHFKEEHQCTPQTP